MTKSAEMLRGNPWRSRQARSGGWLAAIASMALMACDAGPSESEFVAACLKEGARGANRAMRREMGVQPEAFCRCAAAEAKARLPAEARQAMVLDMQGKTAEARAISSKLNEADQMAFMQGTMKMLEACMLAAR